MSRSSVVLDTIESNSAASKFGVNTIDSLLDESVELTAMVSLGKVSVLAILGNSGGTSGATGAGAMGTDAVGVMEATAVVVSVLLFVFVFAITCVGLLLLRPTANAIRIATPTKINPFETPFLPGAVIGSDVDLAAGVGTAFAATDDGADAFSRLPAFRLGDGFEFDGPDEREFCEFFVASRVPDADSDATPTDSVR